MQKVLADAAHLDASEMQGGRGAGFQEPHLRRLPLGAQARPPDGEGAMIIEVSFLKIGPYGWIRVPQEEYVRYDIELSIAECEVLFGKEK
jgi:hypothetical protein